MLEDYSGQRAPKSSQLGVPVTVDVTKWPLHAKAVGRLLMQEIQALADEVGGELGARWGRVKRWITDPSVYPANLMEEPRKSRLVKGFFHR